MSRFLTLWLMVSSIGACNTHLIETFEKLKLQQELDIFFDSARQGKIRFFTI